MKRLLLCHSRRSIFRSFAFAWLALLLPIPPVVWADCRPVEQRPSITRQTGEFSHGLLWKVEAPGMSPSHLFGTFHSSDPRIVRLPCPVKRAFDRADSYTMEMIMNGTGLVSMAEAMFFSDGKTLRQVLGESLYRDTIDALDMPTSHPDGLNSMKPWAVLMMLSTPRQGGGLFLDLSLQLEAARMNKPTYGLESMREQIEVFNGMSLEDQVVLLRDAVRQRRHLAGLMETLTRFYLERDLDGLVRLSDQYRSADARVHRDLMDRLLTQRNHHMMKRMQERLKEGNAFIAVGALHLPGPSGLLQLLSTAGYRVTAVY